MKKIKVLFLTIFLALVSVFTFTIHAEPVFIEDDYGLLTNEEIVELESLAERYSNIHDCGIYIRIKNDYAYDGYQNAEDYAEYLYRTEDMGNGLENNGVLFLVVMIDRSYDICAYGETANASFTNYDKDVMSDNVVYYLSDGQYYEACKIFIENSDSVLSSSENEGYSNNEYNYQPYVEEKRSINFSDLSIFAVIAAIISAIITGIKANAHKTKGRKYEASNYINQAGTKLTGVSDRFLYANEVRTRIRRNDGGPNHGGPNHGGPSHGGTSVNSGGFSHHSGHF